MIWVAIGGFSFVALLVLFIIVNIIRDPVRKGK